MKEPDYLKSMFDFVKGLGGMKEYADFEEYNREKFGIDKKETPKDEYEIFLNEMPEKEREDYFTIFGRE